MTASSRLEYNVPTAYTHSQRVNGTEILSIGTTINSYAGIQMNGNSVYLGSGALYMNSTNNAYIYTPAPNNITYFRNNNTNGQLNFGTQGTTNVQIYSQSGVYSAMLCNADTRLEFWGGGQWNLKSPSIGVFNVYNIASSLEKTIFL